MERPDEILALRRVYPGLATNRRIGLGEKARRHRHPAASAFEQGCGKTGEVADHPAADRDDVVGSTDAGFDHRLEQCLQLRHRLAGFTGRKDEPAANVTSEPVRPTGVGDILVGDEKQSACRELGVVEQADANPDRVTEAIDIDHPWHSSALIIWSTILCGGRFPHSTCRSAKA